MSDILQETNLSDRQRDCADTIRTSGQHLLAIINDILDFSKIEAGKLTLEHVAMDLRRCVEEALDLVALSAADKLLDLSYEIAPGTPEGVIGDSGRVRQVLANRSEEHTSELQSRLHLVCRPPLEKKRSRAPSRRTASPEHPPHTQHYTSLST